MRTQLPPSDVTRLLVKHARRALGAEHLVQWAVDRLLAGSETPALIRLAGLDLDAIPVLSDALPLFRKALDDLKINADVPQEEILRFHLRDLARELLGNEENIAVLVARIEREVVCPLEHPADLVAWCHLDDGLDADTYAPLDRPALEERARRLAEDALREE